MAPIELSYSINEHLQEEVTAPDGILATVDTPAGRVFAKVEKQKIPIHPLLTFLAELPLLYRVGIHYPGDPTYIQGHTKGDGLHYDIQTITDLFSKSHRRWAKADKLAYEKTLQVPEGELLIQITASNEPSES